MHNNLLRRKPLLFGIAATTLAFGGNLYAQRTSAQRQPDALNAAFILFHTGETKSLMPSMLKMASKTDKYNIRIVPVGQAAKSNLPNSLDKFIKTPSFISDGECGNETSEKEFPPEYIQEILALCVGYDNVVIGWPAKIQEQVAQALPPNNNKIIYFDGVSNKSKINGFAPFADTLVFTTLVDKQNAQQIIAENEDLTSKPEVVTARHGNFDSWLAAYKDLADENTKKIRESLNVSADDRIILWAGGYGKNLSSDDEEAIAFKFFLETFKAYQQHFKLRITLHPGIKTYPENKRNDIIKAYYIQPLLALGLSADEVNKMITPAVDTQQAVSVSLGVISVGSTVSAPAIYTGARSKTIMPSTERNYFEGVENVNTSERLSILLERWAHKDRRHQNDKSYANAINKLKIPTESTEFVIENAIQRKRSMMP